MVTAIDGGGSGPDFVGEVRFEPTQEDAAYRALIGIIFGPVVAEERQAS